MPDVLAREMKMTDRDYVLRASKVYNISIIGPKKGSPEILGLHTTNGFSSVIIDALTWKLARQQLSQFEIKRAA